MRNEWFWRRAGSLFPRREAMDSGSSSRPAWAILSSPRRRRSCLSFWAATFTGTSPGCRKRCASPCASRGSRPTRVEGSLLWTHFGASGPAVLDASRFWCRARLEGCDPSGLREPASRKQLRGGRQAAPLDRGGEAPPENSESALGSMLPASIGKAVLGHLGFSAEARHRPARPRRPAAPRTGALSNGR